MLVGLFFCDWRGSIDQSHPKFTHFAGRRMAISSPVAQLQVRWMVLVVVHVGFCSQQNEHHIAGMHLEMLRNSRSNHVTWLVCTLKRFVICQHAAFEVCHQVVMKLKLQTSKRSTMCGNSESSCGTSVMCNAGKHTQKQLSAVQNRMP